jgi:lysophospholipase L1-like esterase
VAHSKLSLVALRTLFVTLVLLAGCEGTSLISSVTTSPLPAGKQIWIAAWGDAPTALDGPASAEQTFRQIVKPTVGSRGTVRLHFSNYFGTSAVTLGAVHLGVQTTGAGVSGDMPITFNGATSASIPAGGFLTSDPVTLNFSYGAVLAVTEYVAGSWSKLTEHNQGNGNVTSYATAANAGNATGDTAGAAFTQTIYDTYLVDRVEVFGGYTGTIATFGGSTTDGLYSGVNAHMSYPEQLAAALHAAGRDDVGIANEGISGDTVLGTGATAGENRFARDVAALPGVYGVIDYLGANDLRDTCVNAAAVIAGKQNLAQQAHAAGLKIFVATTAPSTFCGAQNPGGFGTRFAQGSGEDAQRFLLNAWTTSTVASIVNGVSVAAPTDDAVIDFNGALVDASNTSYMLPALDSGDDIHPNATGYGAMVKAIPLSLF